MSNWANLNATSSGGSSKGSGNGAIILLVVVASACCCMLVCGFGVWWGSKEGWFDDWFKKEEDTLLPTPTEEEDVTPDEESEQPAGDSGGTTTTNKTDKGYYCKSPWDRQYIRFDKDGKNPRCCQKADSDHKWCNADDIVTVPNKNFPVAELHNNLRRIGKDNIEKLELGRCPSTIGAGTVEGVSYYELNSQDVRQQWWCHPSKGGKGYAVYPVCFNNNVADATKQLKKGGKCSNGTTPLWRPSSSKLFGSAADRFKFVEGGGRT